jgi:hypothetical protein
MARSIPVLTMILSTLLTLTMTGAIAGPSDVQGDIQVQGEYPVVITEGETLGFDIEGYFAVTGRSGFESVGTISARLTISEGQWNPVLSQTTWNSVDQNENYDFTISVTIPNGTGLGESSAYTLLLTFYNSLDQEVGSDTAGFSVRVETILPSSDDDDDTSDDDDMAPIEDESFPLWPFFIIFIVIGLVIVAIWLKRNIEVVREEDGSHRVLFREKDSGHILGRKKQPPPELDL